MSIPSEQRRRRRTRAQWSGLVASQAASGLSVEAFCAEHDLGVKSFKRWRSRVGQPLVATAGFIEVAAPEPTAKPVEGLQALELELDLAEGVRLRLRRG